MGAATREDEPEALEAVKMLIELGNDVQAVNDRGETALHGAAYRGAPSIVEYLVEQGAQIDARSDQGWTPWTIANGVFYSLFYKEQPQTADVLAELMAARGISTEGMSDELRTCFDCGRNRRTLRDKEGKRVAQPTPDRVPVQDTPPEQQAAPAAAAVGGAAGSRHTRQPASGLGLQATGSTPKRNGHPIVWAAQ